MPVEGNGAVRGSVIQRTLIPEGLSTVLSVATVPVSELIGTDGREAIDFTRLVADVLGVAEESILDQDGYAKLEPRLRDGSLWGDFGPHPFWREMYDYLYGSLRYQEPAKPLGEGPSAILASHALTLMVRPAGLQNAFFLPTSWPRRMQQEELSEESVELAVRCFVASRTPNTRVSAFIERIGEYDVPSGQSPKAKSDSLLQLVDGTKAVCLAPLATGGANALSQLNQGHFVTALLSTSTAAAMSLILIGTVSVADYLVHHMVHQRKKPNDPTPERGPGKGPNRTPGGQEQAVKVSRATEQKGESRSKRAALFADREKIEKRAGVRPKDPRKSAKQLELAPGAIEDDDMPTIDHDHRELRDLELPEDAVAVGLDNDEPQQHEGAGQIGQKRTELQRPARKQGEEEDRSSTMAELPRRGR